MRHTQESHRRALHWLQAESEWGFVIISGAPHVNLGIIFGGVCMAVQGIECTSWLLAEKLHLGWAMRLVEGAEGWEDVTTTRANSWLQATAAVYTEIWKHSLRDADLWVARQLRQFEKRTGGDEGRGAWRLDTLAYVWPRQERSMSAASCAFFVCTASRQRYSRRCA